MYIHMKKEKKETTRMLGKQKKVSSVEKKETKSLELKKG